MRRREDSLYEQHAQKVYRYLCSLTGNPDLAEDLTQETFYQALKSLHTFRGDCTPYVWLCAIAKRLWYRELDRQKKHPPLEETHLASLAASDNPEAELQERDERLRLYRAMQQLPADTREVMYLRLNGDFSFREIGEIMQHSEAWARVRFYRGKQQLINLLGGGTNETE